MIIAGQSHDMYTPFPLGGGFTSKRGVFGRASRPVTMLCITYGTVDGQSYSGGADGRVYHWNGNTLRASVEAHKGPVFAVQRVEKVGHWNLKLKVKAGMRPPAPVQYMHQMKTMHKMRIACIILQLSALWQQEAVGGDLAR